MIVYFANRELEVLGSAATDLPRGIYILDDEKHEEIATGVRTFTATFAYDNESRELVESVVSVGNFLLRSANDENEFYTIISTEHDTDEQTIEAYAEDAGLDLLNTVAPQWENEDEYDLEYYATKWLPAGWEIGTNEIATEVEVLSWQNEGTLTERLLDIANGFGGELDFSYEIDRLQVTKRYINFYNHKGNNAPVYQLRLGGDVSQIRTSKNIEELATAFIANGGTLNGQKTPINLSGCDYSSDGTTVHEPADVDDPYQIVGTQVRCIPAMEKWASSLDSDGLLVRRFSSDTVNKKKLFKQAVAELKKVINEAVSYDLTFISFPDDARLGDWVHVVDDQDNIYLQGRILTLEKSIVKNETNATLGEWIVKTSGISERLLAFANELQKTVLSATSITITSSAGIIFNNTAIVTTLTATVWYGETEITNQTQLEEIFGDTAAVNWYNNGSLVGTGFSYAVSSGNNNESYIVRVEA